MQDLIKRNFWVLGALVVMVCAVFAAKATSHIVEAKYLGDPDHAPKLPTVAPSPMTTPVKQSRNKDGTPLTSRNMFCSECTPAVATVTDPSQIANTSLPLILQATNVDPVHADQSYATITNTENSHQGAYTVGDQIPGASGKLKVVHYKYIDFENNGHVERLVLAGATVPVVAVAEAPAAGSGDELQVAVDNGIKKIDDNNYEIDKSLVDKVLANPMAVAKGARIVPAVKNGKTEGFKLYAIRPDSVYAKLGLQNGDTLASINGFELTDANKALEVYTKLRDATSLELDVVRRGKSEKLKYSIR